MVSNPKFIPFGNPGNLTPSEAGKRGGATFSIRKFLRARKNCNHKCPFYYTGCPYMNLSKDRFEGKCALKQMPDRLQHRTIRALMMDEQGWLSNMIEFMLDLENQVRLENEAKLKLKFFDRMLRMYESIFGKRIKMEANVNTVSPQEVLANIEKLVKEEVKGGSNDELAEDRGEAKGSDNNTT